MRMKMMKIASSPFSDDASLLGRRYLLEQADCVSISKLTSYQGVDCDNITLDVSTPFCCVET